MVLWKHLCDRLQKFDVSISNTKDAHWPFGFIGLSGVYDITEHFEHETKRGVAALSCMASAMGGSHCFQSLSPVVLFKSLLFEKSGFQLDSPEQDTDRVCVDRFGVLLPVCTFISSHQDLVVPPTTSLSLHEVLLELGCNSQIWLFESLQHSDFVFWGRRTGLRGLEVDSLIERIVYLIMKED